MLRYLKKLLQIGNLSCCIVSVLVLGQLIVPISESFAQPAPFPEIPTTEKLGAQALASRDNVSEARNGADNLLCRVWRGETNNQVWVAMGDGRAFTITPNTQTVARPSVVPFGDSQYMILHTGTDQRLYFTIINPDGGGTGGWAPINTTFGNITLGVRTAPAATQLGAGREAVGLAFLGIDGNVYFASYTVTFGWDPIAPLQGGRALAAPAIAYNPVSDYLVVAVAGTNGYLWINWAHLGSPTWGGWTDMRAQMALFYSPSIAVNPNDGTMMLSILDPGNTPRFLRLNSQTITLGDWGTNAQVFNTITRGHIYAVAVIFVSNVFWALWNADSGVNFYGRVK
jgi:hypothetical protein